MARRDPAIPIERAIYQGNRCPVCARYHRGAGGYASRPTAVGARHAAQARALGTTAYDYDREGWVDWAQEARMMVTHLAVHHPEVAVDPVKTGDMAYLGVLHRSAAPQPECKGYDPC
jgi:hypothetical protein